MSRNADEASVAPGATHYSVREIVRATGIGEHTLRAWERRYGAVVPERTPGGTRQYTRRDLVRLVDLKRAVDAGHRIGAISSLSDSELAALPMQREGASGGAPDASPWGPALAEILRFEAAEAERLLSLQFSALGPAAFGKQVALPLLRELGDLWHQGKVSSAAEHLATSIVRNLLGIALRSRPRGPHSFSLLTTSLAGERHEAGLLVAGLLAADAGLRVVHLGVDLPATDIALAASDSGADAVLLAMTSSNEASSSHLEALDSALPAGIEIWTGGPLELGGVKRRNRRHFNDLSEMEVHLRAIETEASQGM